MIIIVYEHPKGFQECSTLLGRCTGVRDIAFCGKPFRAVPSGLRHGGGEEGQECLF